MGILYEERANKEEKTVNYPYSLCMDGGAERHDNRRGLGTWDLGSDWGIGGVRRRRCCACHVKWITMVFFVSCVVVLQLKAW